MKALILYVVFVTIGGLLSVAIGYLVEPKVSMTASLIVFLTLFFANFVASAVEIVIQHAHGIPPAGARPAPQYPTAPVDLAHL